jgi:DNA-binding Lrp family transcriptional regulator
VRNVKVLTQKDQELLALLRVNAREPVAALARKLGLSRTTVNDRLRRLEKDGTVAGYMVKLRSDDTLGGFSAIITLAAEPRKHIDVAKALGRIAEVELLYAVSGKHDFIVKARTHSPEDMDRLIDQLAAVPGVVEVETSVILSTKVDRR